MLRNKNTIAPKQGVRSKQKNTPLEPPCPKPLHRILSVPWPEQQGKYCGLKIKKSYNTKRPLVYINLY
jgi:hypothetical protein